MAMIAVQCMVADYAKFRPVFEKGAARRAAAGITNPRVYRNADNGNDVLVVGDVANVAKAREALGSPEYRAQMQEGGLVGAPKVHVIE